MEILNIKVLTGPNYWSNHWKKLIVIELDLTEFEDITPQLIPDFSEKIGKLLPSLDQHYCSKGHRGGLLQTLKENIELGHVIEHIALELQALAGMECRYGQTHAMVKPGLFNVIFSYEIEAAGVYAAKAAVQIVKNLTANIEYTNIENDILNLKQIKFQQGLSVSTKALVAEAIARNIPVMELQAESSILLGQGCKQKILSGTLTSLTSCMGVNFAVNKNQTNDILTAAHLNVPKRSQIASPIIVEKYIQGNDFRFLVINYQLVAVAQRWPACVIGNGVSTIKALIDEVNNDPRRGENQENILSKINLDESTTRILAELGFTTETILDINYKLYLKNTPNLRTGGTSVDVTDIVHPQNRFIAERVARLFHLDVCGIDMVMDRVDLPCTKNNSAIINVNATPGLRMHLKPSMGLSRNVAKNIIDMLYPAGTVCRIPIIAVSGTYSTIITQWIAYFAQHTGYYVGCSNTDGVYINNQFICGGECSGAQSAKIILRDPLINFAVLECPQQDILNSGLGFDHCSISIIEDSIVAQSTLKEGYAILNADEDAVYAIKNELDCHLALFSMHADNPRIQQHIQNEGMCAYVDENELIIHHGKNILRLGNFGSSAAMIQHLLPAVLAGLLANIPHQDIARCLKNFGQFLSDEMAVSE